MSDLLIKEHDLLPILYSGRQAIYTPTAKPLYSACLAPRPRPSGPLESESGFSEKAQISSPSQRMAHWEFPHIS